MPKIPNSKLSHYLLIGGSILFILMSVNCFNTRRRANFNWQLDSLRYYTTKFDSILMAQTQEMSQLHVDLYTKYDEMDEKLEMLNTRLSETELQLTRINEKLGTSRKVEPDSSETSQINPEARIVYESAYLSYVKGNYTEAINSFQSYLKIAPDSPLADNALYWIGESYAAMGKRQNAVDTFQELISKYPQSSKKPTALYKIGLIYEESKDSKTANSYYQQVLKEFPNSPEATLAKNKLK